MLIPYRGPEKLQELPPVAVAPDTQGEFGEPSDGVNWPRVLSAIRRHKWLILGIVALGVAGGVLSMRFTTAEYQVGATIFIADGGGQMADRNGPIRASSLLQTSGWVELLRSFAVVDPVVQRQKLYVITKSEADNVLFDSLRLSPRYRPGHYTLA